MKLNTLSHPTSDFRSDRDNNCLGTVVGVGSAAVTPPSLTSLRKIGQKLVKIRQNILNIFYNSLIYQKN